MAEPFGGIKAKLDRLLTTATEINEEVESFLSGDTNGVVNDFKSEPGYLIVKAFSKSDVPPLISVLVGETLYHLRSVLDHLACELTKLNNHPVDTGTEYPIWDDADTFRNPTSGLLTKRIKAKIGGIDPAEQAIIEEEQPFERYKANPHDDPLWLLYELSNFDRHQALHPTSAFTDVSSVTFAPPSMSERFRLISTSYGTLEGETEIARYAIVSGQGADVKVDTQARFNIAFGKGGPGTGRPIVSTVGDIAVRVAELIQKLI